LSIKAADEAWHQLRQGGHLSSGSEIPSLPAGVIADAGPVRYALGPAGEGRLLLPLSASERIPRIPETPTLRLKDAVYVLEGGSWRFLDLTCLVRELDGVFAEVCGEVVARISSGHAALEACVSTLSEFRQLLLPRSQEVETEAICGLVGELLLLNEFLLMTPDAAGLWRGPLGERHDFRAGTLAIEVKTAGRAGSESMRISSIDQLVEPAGGSLWVVRFTIERTKGGRLTVAALFDQAIARASNAAELGQLLHRMGCPDQHSPEWNCIAFEEQESRTYSIGDGFPRIVPGSFGAGAIPAGISDVKYTVDLTTAREFLLSAEEARSCRERMVECLRQP
jgi:hypothetical protein